MSVEGIQRELVDLVQVYNQRVEASNQADENARIARAQVATFREKVSEKESELVEAAQAAEAAKTGGVAIQLPTDSTAAPEDAQWDPTFPPGFVPKDGPVDLGDEAFVGNTYVVPTKDPDPTLPAWDGAENPTTKSVYTEPLPDSAPPGYEDDPAWEPDDHATVPTPDDDPDPEDEGYEEIEAENVPDDEDLSL